MNAECVLDLKIGELAVVAVGTHEVTVIFAKEGGRDAVVVETRFFELSQYGRGRRVLHRLRVLRAAPGIGLGGMA